MRFPDEEALYLHLLYIYFYNLNYLGNMTHVVQFSLSLSVYFNKFEFFTVKFFDHKNRERAHLQRVWNPSHGQAEAGRSLDSTPKTPSIE